MPEVPRRPLVRTLVAACYSAAMKYHVKRLKSLAVALKELEPHIRDGRKIKSHPEFNSIKQRPRELLGNWLMCAVANAERPAETVHIYSDPFDGDGMLVDSATDEKMFIEQVYARAEDGDDPEALITKAFSLKAGRGEEYAAGRTLVILSEAGGPYFPNRLARQFKGKHHFKGVWLLGLDAAAIADGRYAYTCADISGDTEPAPVWRVALADDFSSRTVARLQ
jgi:hypothetical protein